MVLHSMLFLRNLMLGVDEYELMVSVMESVVMCNLINHLYSRLS